MKDKARYPPIVQRALVSRMSYVALHKRYERLSAAAEYYLFKAVKGDEKAEIRLLKCKDYMEEVREEMKRKSPTVDEALRWGEIETIRINLGEGRIVRVEVLNTRQKKRILRKISKGRFKLIEPTAPTLEKFDELEDSE